MTRVNREALTEVQGILFGLSFAAPEAISKGILAAMDVIIDVLDSEQAQDIKLSTCCQHEDIPPCEEEIYENAECGVQSAECEENSDELIMSLEDTLRMFECCSRYVDGDEKICRCYPLCDPESTECGSMTAMVKSGAYYMRMLYEEHC